MTLSARCCTRAPTGAAVLLALALLGPGCVRQAPETHADAAERAACGQHADTVYRMRNPADIYREDTYDTSTRDTPFNGAGLSSVPTRGLSGQFERDQLLRDCLNGGGGTVGAAPDAPMPEETPPGPPSAHAPVQP